MSGRRERRAVDMNSERFVRNYAIHIGLRVIRRGGEFTLYERDHEMRPGEWFSRCVGTVVGRYRSWATVSRAIDRWNTKTLREVQRQGMSRSHPHQADSPRSIAGILPGLSPAAGHRTFSSAMSAARRPARPEAKSTKPGLCDKKGQP
jgi:hypothetical protein